ncbi:MAG: PAS domain-containing protein [Candidatus Methanomethyliaceae archaeon]|nr:PAS domain-containing protein [Candidatus Methanomethyliaceae archaeon]
MELSRDILDLIFREERILFPSLWVLLSEGEWAAIHEAAKDIGYLVSIDVEWMPKASPLLPHEVNGAIKLEQIEKLPKEFKSTALANLTPDDYKVKGDLKFENGFLSMKEVESIFKHLPIEITYADANDRVTFFSESALKRGFTRAKTIIGRRLEYCHPPRLENFVRNVINELKSGKADFKEYWTKLGDRVIRVIIVAIRDNGNYLGTLEMVEDLTEVVNNPEEVKSKIIIL